MAIPKKPRKCRVCKSDFQPSKPLQNVCSPDCALIQAKAKRAKAERIAGISDRKVVKAKLESIKPRNQVMKEAQAAFNEYRREVARANGYPCISSGKPLDWSGNSVDAGHYRSIGSAPHLRFDERNVHAQAKHDNRYLSGNVTEYRKGLIARIGIDAVEELEADQTPRKYTIEELKAIKSKYAAMTKELRK